ncbi:MAG: DNA mismatch repair protein MutS, partial [Oligoflexia bacterium]|nr:DNA mismatch repair protein MutS [Oligoflexia bacterium]
NLGFEIEELMKKESYPLSEPEKEKVRLLRDKIKRIISPNCPFNLKEGGLINKGVNPQLDEWINLAKNSQAHLLEMEKREQKKLNIPSLKIRYNSVFGYYIEVRKIYNSKIPEHYERKQTLVQAERYMTKELYQLEQKILSARSKQIEKEQEIFRDLRAEILEALSLLFKYCDRWTEVDLYSSLAFLAVENKYVRPIFTNRFKLVASRHPVLEQKTFHEFVPNTVNLPSSQTVLLTGPNMAGKSTLMRQFALTVLLAQSACFVPADRAELPLFHKMF